MTDVLTLRPWWANKLYASHYKAIGHGYMEFTMRRPAPDFKGQFEHAVVQLRCSTWYLFVMHRNDKNITPPDQVIWFEPFPDDVGETNVSKGSI